MMKKKFLAILGAVICVSLTACTSQQSEKDNNRGSEEAKPTQESVQPTETPKPTETIHNIGETITFKDWGIVVTDFKIAESIAADYGEFSPEEAGNKFAQVYVTVTNNAKEADHFMPMIALNDDVTVKLLYGDGYEFDSTYLLGYSNDLHDADLNPLTSKNGEIVFEIPENVANAGDELLLEFSAGNDNVKVKIR